MDFDDEKELRDWLAKQFKKYGWRAWTEKRPHGTDYRADIIVYHHEYGYIGIECKHMNTLSAGSYIGKALEQVLFQYRGKSYDMTNGSLDLWAVCPYAKYDRSHTADRQTVREMLCHFGIGIIWPCEDPERMMVDFAYSDSATKISISDPTSDRYGDRERIEEMVQKKIRSEEDGSKQCQYDTNGHGCTAPSVGFVEVNNYEIYLCEHHLNQHEKARWNDEKSRIEASGCDDSLPRLVSTRY